MSKDKIIIIVAAAAGLYMLSKIARGSGSQAGGYRNTASSLNGGGTVPVSEVMNPGNTNGWRYFTDGTAISPGGDYYLNGQLVYTAASAGMMSASGN